MKNQQDLLGLAIKLASKHHYGQKDKGGNPYILHCLTVMHKVKSSDLEIKQIAVMHDLLEDTPVSAAYLHQLGFSSRVLTALQLLTRVQGQSEEDYLEGIASNKDAILVKLADLRHNSDITRLKGLTTKDFTRMEKYQKAYVFLSTKLSELN